MNEYLDSLPHKVQYKFAARIKIIPELGLEDAIRVRYVRKIVPYKNLYEIRMRFSHRQERIMYCQLIGDTYVLLCGFTKSSPQKQRRAVRHAVKLRQEVGRGYKDGTIKIV